MSQVVRNVHCTSFSLDFSARRGAHARRQLTRRVGGIITRFHAQLSRGRRQCRCCRALLGAISDDLLMMSDRYGVR